MQDTGPGISRQAKPNTPVDTKKIMETAKKIYCGVAKKLMWKPHL